MRKLQVAEDLALQRRTWAVERAGWAFFAAVLAAAAVGLFGGGLLGDAERRTADGTVTVEYPRFARVRTPLEIAVRLAPAPASDGELRVWMTREYLAELRVLDVTPPPERVELGAGRVEFVFAWRGVRGDAEIAFIVEAREPGAVRGLIGSGSAPGIAVRHFLHP